MSNQLIPSGLLKSFTKNSKMKKNINLGIDIPNWDKTRQPCDKITGQVYADFLKKHSLFKNELVDEMDPGFNKFDEVFLE